MRNDICTMTTPKPLFLHISIGRLILLSIASCGLYEAYWIYKNWRYIKERSGLDISPFWRGIFGIFYCHGLLKKIHGDSQANGIQKPSFSPGGLAIVWITLIILANLVGRAPGALASVVSFVIPSYLCLVPVQNYINSVEEKRSPGARQYGWSAGHVVCLAFGLIVWALTLLMLWEESSLVY